MTARPWAWYAGREVNMYYISWSPSLGCRYTRCFGSEAERDEFRRRVEGIKGANIRTWEYFPD